MRMTEKLLLIVAVASLSWAGMIAGTRDDMAANPLLAANNYRAYPDQNLPVLTPAPEGYEPFYIDHYGRHGSRWLISPEQYHYGIAVLEKAEKAGKIAERGRQVLAMIREVEAASSGRLGELSDVGAEQHQRIARRMYGNFPQVFAGNAHVDAKSTIVIRCILSMQNATGELMALNPALRITVDASRHDMNFMNFTDTVAGKLRSAAAKSRIKELQKRYVNTSYTLGRLFADSIWAKQNCDDMKLVFNLADLAGNMQSHHQFEHVNLYDLFTTDELYSVWACNNAFWYIYAGFTPVTRGRVPYMEANLLRDFISTADAHVASGDNGANLRFGHESVVLPLVSLMGLDGYDYSTADVDDIYDLGERWPSYKVFPMGCNVQWVFYRNQAGGDVLIKVLLNEHEARLPEEVKPVNFPYYRWTDVRGFYERRLAKQPF